VQRSAGLSHRPAGADRAIFGARERQTGPANQSGGGLSELPCTGDDRPYFAGAVFAWVRLRRTRTISCAVADCNRSKRARR
jgi:hypothetical protein